MIQELGFYVPTLRGGKAFVPSAPDKIDGIETLMSDVDKCASMLARLDTLIHCLPNPYLLTENLIFMEAVTSSRIEGTKTRFEDLFSKNPDAEAASVLEVKNCAEAFRQGENVLLSAHSVVDFAQKLGTFKSEVQHR